MILKFHGQNFVIWESHRDYQDRHEVEYKDGDEIKCTLIEKYVYPPEFPIDLQVPACRFFVKTKTHKGYVFSYMNSRVTAEEEK